MKYYILFSIFVIVIMAADLSFSCTHHAVSCDRLTALSESTTTHDGRTMPPAVLKMRKVSASD